MFFNRGMVNELVEIVEFDPSFKKIYETYKKLVKSILPNIELELIGSAAVPMKGKKEIDIMIVVEDIKDIQSKLTKLGFSKGPIEGKTAYMRDYRFGIEVEFHIVQKGSKKIVNARKLVNILRNDGNLRKQFEELKEQYNGLNREEYRKRKSLFIQKILES